MGAAGLQAASPTPEQLTAAPSCDPGHIDQACELPYGGRSVGRRLSVKPRITSRDAGLEDPGKAIDG